MRGGVRGVSITGRTRRGVEGRFFLSFFFPALEQGRANEHQKLRYLPVPAYDKHMRTEKRLRGGELRRQHQRCPDSRRDLQGFLRWMCLQPVQLDAGALWNSPVV